MADERVQLNVAITRTVPNAVWTRIGDWEVLQTSGANVNVTVDNGEVSLPCAGMVRMAEAHAGEVAYERVTRLCRYDERETARRAVDYLTRAGDEARP